MSFWIYESNKKYLTSNNQYKKVLKKQNSKAAAPDKVTY
jgi:hypothetical protein